MCKVNLVPRIFSLPPSREEEREPWELGTVGVRWLFVTKFVNEKTQLLCKWLLELKAVLYFSADLYLTAQTTRGNHEIAETDKD